RSAFDLPPVRCTVRCLGDWRISSSPPVRAEDFATKAGDGFPRNLHVVVLQEFADGVERRAFLPQCGNVIFILHQFPEQLRGAVVSLRRLSKRLLFGLRGFHAIIVLLADLRPDCVPGLTKLCPILVPPNSVRCSTGVLAAADTRQYAV